ncbi:MAG: hypothetical protein D4R58_00235 [Betaproteobacteria bacterium]|nr:MAG: hypothetical protein D4R58_00235 [Betaproteobacteria bacterium]
MTRALMMLRRLLVAAGLAAVVGGAAAQEVKLFPVDEGASDPNWARFKARLLDAIEKRDQKFVMGIVDARIRNTLGKDGSTEFRKLWQPQAADSALWIELPKLLFLGGVFVKRDQGGYEFCAPYVRFKWPDNAPADASGAIIVADALMKAKPSAAADTLRTLSHDLVKVLDWEVADEDQENQQQWVRIQTGAGAGYVPEEHIRSPLEHRACFAKSGTGWRMTGLEAGE